MELDHQEVVALSVRIHRSLHQLDQLGRFEDWVHQDPFQVEQRTVDQVQEGHWDREGTSGYEVLKVHSHEAAEEQC